MEIWKPIPRFDGVIEVSNIGNVRRVASQVRGRANSLRTVKARALKPRCHPWGYYWHEFSVHGKRYWDFAHRLVLEAFVGPCPSEHYVLHFDNNPKNNRLENLRYGTPSDNSSDKLMHGTQPHGEQIPWHKLKNADVLNIRHRRQDGETLEKIGEDYGVSETYIWQICTGVKWKNAGGPIEEKFRKVNILNAESRLALLKDRAEGLGYKRLAKKYVISITQAYNIVNPK
jgi:Mor family transcriptional regulator